MSTFYDLKADLPKGEKLDFATLKGKVVLIVNTASAWYVVHLAIALAVV
jgi:peroxiredoxin